MTEHMLTTIDNPFNPFTQFDEWFEFDSEKNYNCCQVLAMFVIASDSFSERFQANEIEAAIDEAIHDPRFAGIYVKVSKESKIIPIPVEEVLSAVS